MKLAQVASVVVLALAVFLGGFFLGKNLLSLGSGSGQVHYFVETFLDGLKFGSEDNDTLTESNCNSKSFDPASFSSSTVASTSIALSGYALGDTLKANFDSVTSSNQWFVVANPLGAASVTVSWVAVSGSGAEIDGLNLTTSTLEVCYEAQ